MASQIATIGTSFFNSAGGAVGDLFAAEGDRARAQGLRYKAAGAQFEKANYGLAATLADQNAQYTETSTAIKEMQAQRQILQAEGETRADVAASGFATSGSAIDLLRDSASQGALTKAVIGQQGLITEAGYKEQAQSYRNLQSAADIEIQADTAAAGAADKAATGDTIMAGIKGATAILSLL